jgi:hypothetical protein
MSQKCSGNDKLSQYFEKKCEKNSENARNFRNLCEIFIFHFIFSFVSLAAKLASQDHHWPENKVREVARVIEKGFENMIHENSEQFWKQRTLRRACPQRSLTEKRRNQLCL